MLSRNHIIMLLSLFVFAASGSFIIANLPFGYWGKLSVALIIGLIYGWYIMPMFGR